MWEDLAFLRENWDWQIVLKGIQTVEDAHDAHTVMDARKDGIGVSNHGALHIVPDLGPRQLLCVRAMRQVVARLVVGFRRSRR
jgi:(S)-mandelate dehydrogenase